jgi:hypothetical protein
MVILPILPTLSFATNAMDSFVNMTDAMQVVNGLVYLLMVILAIIGAFVALAMIGHASNIITGLAVSLQDAVLPATVITAGMSIAYFVGDGIYGMALVAAAIRSMAAIVVAVDSYGPITDNVGGIAAVSELPYEVRTITDARDAVGHTGGPCVWHPIGYRGEHIRAPSTTRRVAQAVPFQVPPPRRGGTTVRVHPANCDKLEERERA